MKAKRQARRRKADYAPSPPTGRTGRPSKGDGVPPWMMNIPPETSDIEDALQRLKGIQHANAGDTSDISMALLH